jgi:hypothetical protein
MIRAASIFLVLAFTACGGPPTRLALPTSPSAPPVSSPAPPVRSFTPGEFTAIEVGEVVKRRIEKQPRCPEVGWPCQYFRLTPTNAGTLTVVLTYLVQTNGNQGVDLSVLEAEGLGETWAQSASLNETRVEAPVIAGKTYYIIMWYTNAGLEFELRSSIR